MRTFEQAVEQVLAEVVSDSDTRSYVKELLRHGAEGRRCEGTQAWAARCGYGPKAIHRKMRRAGLASPTIVVAVGAALLVMHRYVTEKPEWRNKVYPSLFTLARSGGWSDGFTFSQWVHNHMGTRPSTLWRACHEDGSIQPLIARAVRTLKKEHVEP